MPQSIAGAQRPKVVVIGSGFGGLFAARALRKADVEITLVARTTHHLFQPLLYQVATGILSPGEIAPTTREVLARQRNVEVLLGTVTSIDLDRLVVVAETLDASASYSFDYLIVAAGAEQSWFGHDEFAEFAPGMKSIDDALELRARIFSAFELAELAAVHGRHDQVERLLTFVVVGAGPTGVEMAGQLIELSHRTLRHDFRHIDPRSARIVLLDAAPNVLMPFAESLRANTQAALEKLGVELLLGAMVTAVDADGIEYQGQDQATHRIEAATKVWAAGVQASPLGRVLAQQAGIKTDRAGRVPVEPDLTVPGHPEVFVVGDLMALDGLPGVAQVAIQGGRYAAGQIKRSVEGKPAAGPFAYHDKGSMATISRFRAIAEIGSLKLTGFVAWLAWLFVHLIYIIGFKSRLTTLISWLVSFVGRGRAERNVTVQQAFGRLAMERVGEDVVRTPLGRGDRPLAVPPDHESPHT